MTGSTRDEPRQITTTGYAQVPYWVVDRLPERARHRHLWVYVALRRLAWQRPIPRSIEDVMDAAGVARAAAYDSARVLTEIGAVIERGTGTRRTWFLPVDDLSPDADESRYRDDPSENRDDQSRYRDGHPYCQDPLEDLQDPPSTTVVADPPGVRELCDYLASRIHDQRAGQDRPSVTTRWLRDMRLLVERGPLGVENPEPVPVEKVRTSIAYLFDHMADPDGSGFCWADVVRSPNALRRHWPKMRDAARRQKGQAVGRGGRAVERAAAARDDGTSTASSGLDRVGADEPIGDLLRLGRTIDVEARET